MRRLTVLLVLAAWSGGALAQWYSGGTLHSANGRQWLAATSANRLATSADFVAKAFGDRKVRSLGSVDRLKPYAHEVKACVDETFQAPGSQDLKVAEVAASCLILLGYY